jgi:hypothetical protein
MLRKLPVLASGLALAACGEAEAPPEPAPAPAPEVAERAPRDPLPAHHPEVEDLQVASRGPRRLSVEEIERTWESIAGLPPGEVQIPENLARSLGDPDWLSVTEPNLEPSPLFMKFMVDLGAILCSQLLRGDRQRPPEARVLLRHPRDVDANLRQLILRFWAVDARSPDHPDVARLRAVYETARRGATGDQGGWLAVCIALSTSPEFLLY